MTTSSFKFALLLMKPIITTYVFSSPQKLLLLVIILTKPPGDRWPTRGGAVFADDPLPNRKRNTPPLLPEDPGYNRSSDLGRSSWSGGWRVRLWTDRSAVRICVLYQSIWTPQWYMSGQIKILVCPAVSVRLDI